MKVLLNRSLFAKVLLIKNSVTLPQRTNGVGNLECYAAIV